MEIDIQHESWIFISMDVFLSFQHPKDIQLNMSLNCDMFQYFLALESCICMHLKLKPLLVDLHATIRSNKTSKLQSTYLGHVPLMTWILNHLKSRLQNTFSHPCYKTLAFLGFVFRVDFFSLFFSSHFFYFVLFFFSFR